MSESNRPFVQDLPTPSTYAGASMPSAGSGPAPAADARDALSWEMAMARAEAPAADAPLQGRVPGAGEMEGFDTAPLSGTEGSSSAQAQTAALAGQPPSAGEPAAPGDAAGALAADASAVMGPGGGGGTMTQEEFLEYKLRRIALGLEPIVTSADMAAALAPEPLGTTAAMPLAQPVSLYVPATAGASALAAADRPVAGDQSMRELVGERVAQQQRSELQAQQQGAEQVAHQVHLEVVNTPESLPLETLKSV